MYETKQELTARKIRNGLRKQAAAVQREKEKVWDILKTDTSKLKPFIVEMDVGSWYYPFMPISASVIRNNDMIINLETTA